MEIMPAVTTKAYFEDINYHIKQLLSQARKSVKISVAWINAKMYSDILTTLANNGVKIEIIFNDDHINTTLKSLFVPNITLFPIKTLRLRSFMHNKFCIIDNEILITGSFNWSKNAYHSFENIIVIKKDYRLIKQFLFEFEDLINFYHANSLGINLPKCPKCRSYQYNLGIFGCESGLYNESYVNVWQICISNCHAELISEKSEQFIHAQLFSESEFDDYANDEYSKEQMLDEYKSEINLISKIQQYFSSNHKLPIHALGKVKLINYSEHIKCGEDAEYIIDIVWRDMCYRKIIPSELYSGGGDIDTIIDFT
jgi:hypothetical protein